ncbi:hypothetical protein KHC28_12275 [Ancylobacter sonchi]|uniref:hypothetical protein n=1 Tax=Ancylobacter sonchi TaxID=1937790 RepID=UPI001BD2D412|nr:hypothetical protein [Ancylobacter sonchi]MBS7534434.1 hypothetical protein [Ancylobacter sonchi]
MEKLDEDREREERKQKAMKAKRQAQAKPVAKKSAPKEPVFVTAPPLASPELPPLQAEPASKPVPKVAPGGTPAPAPASTPAPGGELPGEPAKRAPSNLEAEISTLLTAREQRTQRRLAFSFILAVLVPTLIAGLYLAFLSTPRFMAEAKFIVRGTLEMLGGESTRFTKDLSALSAVTNSQESRILIDNVMSRAMVVRLMDKVDLYALFHVPRQDPDMPGQQDRAFDQLMAKWGSMVHLSMDAISGIMTLNVQAYTAQEALSLSQSILDESSTLINAITARSRQQRLEQATQEVDLARAELAKLLKQFEAFRNQQGTVDANYSALALQGLATLLRDQRVTLNAELATARSSMGEDTAPTRNLTSRLSSLDDEISKLDRQIEGSIHANERSAVPQSLAMQENLETRRSLVIARVSRAEATQSLALADSLRQQAFIMVFEPPSLPHVATFPRVSTDTFIVFLVFFGFWCIGATYARNLHEHG